jgi:hypothetical protein
MWTLLMIPALTYVTEVLICNTPKKQEAFNCCIWRACTSASHISSRHPSPTCSQYFKCMCGQYKGGAGVPEIPDPYCRITRCWQEHISSSRIPEIGWFHSMFNYFLIMMHLRTERKIQLFLPVFCFSVIWLKSLQILAPFVFLKSVIQRISAQHIFRAGTQHEKYSFPKESLHSPTSMIHTVGVPCEGT